MQIRLIAGVFATAALLQAGAALAQNVTVTNSWVRGTVAGQTATGAFMDITSKSDAALIGATSLVAGIVEVHEMTMDGGVMRMRAVNKVDLPAGKTVQLKPGGYHVMLMDLKRPLKKGETVPLTLKIEGKNRKIETVEVKVEVKDLTAAAPAAGGDMHDMHKHSH